MLKTIALISDFGNTDHYVGTMKGVMLSICPEICFVDICHEIAPQDVSHAAFVLKESYPFFPIGTIFLIVVDPGVGSRRKRLIISCEDYTFVLPDNGIIGPVFSRLNRPKVYEITEEEHFLTPASRTFHGRDIFAPVTGRLACGFSPEKFGRRTERFNIHPFPKPVFDRESLNLSGVIVHIDHFGNIVSNISSEDLNVFKDSIDIALGNRSISRIIPSYSDGRPGELVALISSGGFLEIAVAGSSAKELLGVKTGDKIIVRSEKT